MYWDNVYYIFKTNMHWQFLKFYKSLPGIGRNASLSADNWFRLLQNKIAKKIKEFADESPILPRRLVQSQARGCERASQRSSICPHTPAKPPKKPGANHNLASCPLPSLDSSFPSRRPPPAAIEAAPITKGGPHPLPNALPSASAPNLPRAPQVGRRPCDGFGSVDLEGQGGSAPRRARAPDPLRIRELSAH